MLEKFVEYLKKNFPDAVSFLDEMLESFKKEHPEESKPEVPSDTGKNVPASLKNYFDKRQR